MQKISDIELIESVKKCVSQEKILTAKIVLYLEEINRRKLYVEYNTNSMHKFCTKILKYSDAEASLRIAAMRVARDCPEVPKLISNGSLSLNTLKTVDNFLKANPDSDKKKIIERVTNKSQKEAEFILNELLPNPAPIQHKIVLHENTAMKLKAISKELNLSENETIDFLIDGYKQKEMRTNKTESKSKNQRYISNFVKQNVFEKAKHQCEGVYNNKRCESKTYLQLDHIKPVAIGGQSEISNLRVLCFHCNQRSAIKSAAVYRGKIKACSIAHYNEC